MSKTCTTCKFEPDWKRFDERHGFQTAFDAGKCKYPLPKTLTPCVGKTKSTLYITDMNGKPVADAWDGDLCYAWEAKDDGQ